MKAKEIYPPKLFLKFFRWFCHPKMQDYIEGDLMEVYEKRLKKSGKRTADVRFVIDVILLFRPGIIRPREQHQLNTYGMYKSYLKTGWRSLLKSKGYSLINVGGLAIGMTVALFIGLWVHDELSFNKYHKNYGSIAQVWSCSTDPETLTIEGGQSMQYPVSSTLRNNYPQYFKHVLLAWWPGSNTLSNGDMRMIKRGIFIEGGALEMLSLEMLSGSFESLKEPNSIILSKSTADAIFGNEDPINQSLWIDNRMQVEVTGVYKDIPRNNQFNDIQFFSPWSLWLSYNLWAKRENDWDNRACNIYVQLQPNVSMEDANVAIKDLYSKNVPPDFYKTMEKYEPFVQLIPMSTWHLYSEFENGKPAGGLITYVWLFGIVGIFVLLLACINFINLSTARSEKRAREVGVRKVIGSNRRQLIAQFLSESFMVVVIAFTLSIVLATLLRSWFNQLADKDITLPMSNPAFWLIAFSFIVMTSLLAGIYPAFYLSSFQPVKVLKGVLRAGRSVFLPRKMLVVVQFVVSVILIVGTLVVYKQVQFAQNRPVGYKREGLITVGLNDPNYNTNLDVLRNELTNTGVVSGTATSSGPLTAIWNSTSGYEWPGKDPNVDADFAICNIMLDFGKTVDWEIVAGRDFSNELSRDSVDAIIVNEAAVRYMGLENPVGQEFTDVDEFGRKKWTRTIIGVVKDMVMESPYNPVRQTLYFYNPRVHLGLLHIRINPDVSTNVALTKIKEVFARIVPSAFFDYKFVDDEYARKFSQEEKIGKLSSIFSTLAIFISCLGLFGLASYVAEQRTKEIGIRKVLGASVFNLWRMLSRDFLHLVIVSILIATPIAFNVLDTWLKGFQYRTEVSWWIFVVSGSGAIIITMATVSYQALNAAAADPIKSLRSE